MNNHEMMALDEKHNAEFEELVKYCMTSGAINLDLYEEYDVKRGLRDANGKGVLTGLTEISDVVSYKSIDGVKTPIDGELYYQGYNVADLIEGLHGRRYAFEETTYLLLFGELPTAEQLERFIGILSELQELSGHFVRDVIMKAPSANIMNALLKSIVTLYSYDENPEDISPANVLRQSLQLIGKMPIISVYAYHSYRHFKMDDVLLIRNPDKNCSTAENILRMLRPDGKYTELEARVLDVALVLHAEHGGGNNSSFTTRVVTSSLSDTYSVIAAAIGSLKGPRHGGANSKVMAMMEDIEANVSNWNDDGCVADYLTKMLNKEAFDRSGLIYGLGHAVYTKSDPRCEVFRDYVYRLAAEKGREDELALYRNVERIGKELLMERQHKSVLSTNIDFYSGFVYEMLGLPIELYTPLFAVARISGWSAHRMEELSSGGKLIRPRYECVEPFRSYTPMDQR